MPRGLQSQYQVERIVDKRFVKGSPEYKVKWKGYSEQQCTWEKIKNLKTVVDLIMDYQNSKFYVKTEYKDQKRRENCKIISQKQKRPLNSEPNYIQINGNMKVIEQKKSSLILEKDDSNFDKQILENKVEEDQKTIGEEDSDKNNFNELQANYLVKAVQQPTYNSNPSVTNNTSREISLQIGQICKKFSQITRKISGQGSNCRSNNKMSKKAVKLCKQQQKEEIKKVLKKKDDLLLESKNSPYIKIHQNYNNTYYDKSCCLPNRNPADKKTENVQGKKQKFNDDLNFQKLKDKQRMTLILQNKEPQLKLDFKQQIPTRKQKQKLNEPTQLPFNEAQIHDLQQTQISSLPDKNEDSKDTKIDAPLIPQIKQNNIEKLFISKQTEKSNQADPVIRIRQLEYSMTKATQYAVEYESGHIKIHNTLNLILLHPLDFVKYLESKAKVSKI